MTPPERKLALKQLGPLPIYARVKAMVADKILCGEWRPNDRVPSETELVQQLGFSRMTINRAARTDRRRAAGENAGRRNLCCRT